LPLDRRLLALPAFALFESIRVVLTGATFFTRYLVPLLWVVLILFGLGLGSMWDGARRQTRMRRYSAALVLLVFFISGVGLAIPVSDRVLNTQVYRDESALKGIRLWLGGHSPRDATVLLEPLGYIGYYSDRVMIDEVGLVTPRIVELKRQGIVDTARYVEFFRPDFVVVHCDDSVSMQRQVSGQQEFASHYLLAATFNPLNFNPAEPTGAGASGSLERLSCYEVWKRAPS